MPYHLQKSTSIYYYHIVLSSNQSICNYYPVTGEDVSVYVFWGVCCLFFVFVFVFVFCFCFVFLFIIISGFFFFVFGFFVFVFCFCFCFCFFCFCFCFYICLFVCFIFLFCCCFHCFDPLFQIYKICNIGFFLLSRYHLHVKFSLTPSMDNIETDLEWTRKYVYLYMIYALLKGKYK